MSAPVIVNMATGTARFIDDTPQVGDVVMVPHRELADATAENIALVSHNMELQNEIAKDRSLWPVVFCIALLFMIRLIS